MWPTFPCPGQALEPEPETRLEEGARLGFRIGAAGSIFHNPARARTTSSGWSPGTGPREPAPRRREISPKCCYYGSMGFLKQRRGQGWRRPGRPWGKSVFRSWCNRSEGGQSDSRSVSPGPRSASSGPGAVLTSCWAPRAFRPPAPGSRGRGSAAAALASGRGPRALADGVEPEPAGLGQCGARATEREIASRSWGRIPTARLGAPLW